MSKIYPKFSGLCDIREIRNPTLTLREFEKNKIFTTSHDAVRVSTLSRPEVLLKAEPPDTPPITLNAKSNAENIEIGCVENLHLFADDELLPPSASLIPSLTVLDLIPPPVDSTPLSQTQLTARPERNVRLPARFASAESSAFPHAVTIDCRSRAAVTVARTCSKPCPATPSSNRSRIRVTFAPRDSPKYSSSTRSNFEYCNRDEQLW